MNFSTDKPQLAPTMKGFTLVEVLLAAVVSAFIVILTLATYRSVVSFSTDLQSHTEILSQGRYAAHHIRRDLANFFRSPLPAQMRLQGFKAGSDDYPQDGIIFYVVRDQPSHQKHSVADVYEVEYGLVADEQSEMYYLGRRWASVKQLDTGNPGGKLVHLAGYVSTLGFEFYDGKSWQRGWSHNQLPKMVRVTFKLDDPRGSRPPIVFDQKIALAPSPVNLGNDVNTN